MLLELFLRQLSSDVRTDVSRGCSSSTCQGERRGADPGQLSRVAGFRPSNDAGHQPSHPIKFEPVGDVDARKAPKLITRNALIGLRRFPAFDLKPRKDAHPESLRTGSTGPQPG